MQKMNSTRNQLFHIPGQHLNLDCVQVEHKNRNTVLARSVFEIDIVWSEPYLAEQFIFSAIRLSIWIIKNAEFYCN